MAQSFNYPAVVISAPLAGLDVNVHDGAGNPIGSTAGALDVTATLNDPTAGLTGSPVPLSAGFIGGENPSGDLQGLMLTAGRELLVSSATLATEATLSAMSAKLPATLGQQIMTDSLAVVIASDQSAIDVDSSTLATEATLSGLDAKFGTLGQKTMAGSAPVVLASDQAAIPVSQSGNWPVRLQDGSGNAISSTTGALDVNITGGGGANGSVSPTGSPVPADATFIGMEDGAGDLAALVANYGAASGALRVAAQLGNASAVADFGAGATSAQTLRVVLPTDQTAIPVTSGANTNGDNSDSTVSTVATLTAPANSVGFILMNLDTSTANIRWRIGAVATSSSGQQLQPGRDTGYVPVGANISICAESGTQNYNIQWILSS